VQHQGQQRCEGEAANAHGDGQRKKPGQGHDNGAGGVDGVGLHLSIVGRCPAPAPVRATAAAMPCGSTLPHPACPATFMFERV
jgi:hypothetical protein